MKLDASALNFVLRLADDKPASESRQKYCRSCGSLIPYDAVYCPNCGASQETVTTPEAARPRGRVMEAISKRGRRIRLYLFLLSLGIFIAAFLIGSTEPLSSQEALAIVEQFGELIGENPTMTQILMNNLPLCLLFFIPVFGTAFMAFVGYSTGVVLSALAIAYPPADALVLALTTLAAPWTWMELTAYSLASSEGIMLILAIIGRNIRRELKTFLIVLAVSAVLLALGAVIEILAINTAMAGQ